MIYLVDIPDRNIIVFLLCFLQNEREVYKQCKLAVNS